MPPATGVQLDVCKVVMPLLALCASAAAASAQFADPFSGSSKSMNDDAPHAEMRLAIEGESLAPGEQEIAVVFTIDEGWHLYWKNPGETGLPPHVELTLPDGIEQTAETRWPAPERYIHGAGQIIDYIYEREVALLVPVSVSESLVGASVEITATGSWLVCKEACIPGDGGATLSINIENTRGDATSDAALITAMRDRIPSNDASGVTTRWDGLTLAIDARGAQRVEFFPLEPTLGGPSDAINDAARDGERLRVRFDERVVRSERVAGVVGATFNGRKRFVAVTLPPPRRAE